MGLGALLNGRQLKKLPLVGKKVERQLTVFCEHIHKGKKSPDSVYEASLFKMPSILARIVVFSENKQVDKSFAAHGIDLDQCPY